MVVWTRIPSAYSIDADSGLARTTRTVLCINDTILIIHVPGIKDPNTKPVVIIERYGLFKEKGRIPVISP